MTPTVSNLGCGKLLVKEASIKAVALFFVPLPAQSFPHPSRQIVGRWLTQWPHGASQQQAFFTLEMSSLIQNSGQGTNVLCLCC